LTFTHTANVVAQGAAIRVQIRASQQHQWHTVWSEELTENIREKEVEIPIASSHLGLDTFQICFMVDGSLASLQNWYIDNVKVQSVMDNTAILSGKLFISDLHGDMTRMKIKAGDYVTHARADGTYTLYLIPALYHTIQVIDEYVGGQSHNNVTVSANQLLERDFNLHYVVAPINLDASLEGSALTLSWDHNYDSEVDFFDFQHFVVYKQTNSMQFVRHEDTTELYFVDTLLPMNSYRYYVVAQYAHRVSERSYLVYVDKNGDVTEDIDTLEVPLIFELDMNFPNPFNPTTNIKFTIPEASNVTLQIYNVRGQLVRNLRNEFMDKGVHVIQWHGDNDYGRRVGSGIYFIRLHDGKNNAIRKSLLMK
jgi:hypothetical protein